MAFAARTLTQRGRARAPAPLAVATPRRPAGARTLRAALTGTRTLLVCAALIAGLALTPAAAPASAARADPPGEAPRTAALPAVEPGPAALPTPLRLAGADRYATAVAISRRSFPWRASVVYLASGTRFPDGLSAGPAAVHQGGPVLLTPRDRVPQLVLDEIRRLDVDQLVIVGGTPSVSSFVEQQVRALDPALPVFRLGGADRYATSRLIADHAFDYADEAFVATGARFPDALASGAAAALLGGPVLLVQGAAGDLDSATARVLERMGTQFVGIAGDGNSVSAGIEADLDAAIADVERFAGADRFATAVALGELFESPDTVLLASGIGFADALPGGAAAGSAGAPLLLARTSCVPASALAALANWAPEDVLLLGGTPTLSSAVAAYTRC